MNKIGFYLEVGNTAGLESVFRQVRPPVLLMHSNNLNKDLLMANRRTGAPNAFVIGRWYLTNHEQERLLDDGEPAANGRWLAEQILNHDPFFRPATREGNNGRLLIDAWMSLNEAIAGPASGSFAEEPQKFKERLKRYDALQVAFRERLMEEGIEAVAFNFAAGNFREAEHYTDYFDETLKTHKYLGFHEYGWPHLNPAHEHDLDGKGTKSGAGLYQRCMAGIREAYGDQHIVIITELGLTKEYRDSYSFAKDERDQHLGDLGWLNHTQTLSEEFYFDSLRWYNDLIKNDESVLGACLYEVGHSGHFESHRHIGYDNEGRALTIMQKIQSLGQEIAPAVIEATVPTVDLSFTPTVTIRGRVKTRADQAVAGATVRLVGDLATLGAHPQAVLQLSTDRIVWDRQVDGLEGDRWRCYQKYVAQEVAGVPYILFKDQVVAHNPTLSESEHRFSVGKRYRMPRNVFGTNGDAPMIQWGRTIRGFSGNRWLCWQKLIAGRVAGLTWEEFSEQVMVANPHLAADDGVFYADQQYRLPQNSGNPRFEIVTVADNTGRFSFSEIPAGTYRLTISESPYQPVEQEITIAEPEVSEGEVNLAVTLQAVGGFGPLQMRDAVRVVDGHFTQDNQRFPRFTGVNLPHLLYLDDHQYVDAIGDNLLSLGGYLDKTLELGGRVVRTFVPHCGKDGRVFSNTEMAERLVWVLEALNQRNMYLIASFIDLYHNVGAYPHFMADYYKDYGGNDPRVRLGPEFFSTGYRSDEYQAYLRTIIESVPNHLNHTIFSWEIGNELKMEYPGTQPPPGDPAQFVAFNRDIAQMIKTMDSNRHMVTTGMISTQHVHLKGKAELINQLYTDPNIDYLSVHVYYGKQNVSPAEMVVNNEADYDATLAHAFNKPIVVGEAGIDKGNHDFAQRLDTDMHRWLHETHHHPTGQPRRRASGYLIWRPYFGAMGSGHFPTDQTVLQPKLSLIPGFEPAHVLNDNGAQVADTSGGSVSAQQSVAQNKIGIDLNQPITGRTISAVASNPGLIAETGVGWVRLNFVLEHATSTDDPQWQASYDKIIREFADAGLQIYGLIGGQAVKTPLERRLFDSVQTKTSNGSRPEAEAWLAEYEHNFVQIVRRYGDRIKHFESYNEPDNWMAGERRSVLHPTWFAELLDRIYRRVKSEFPDITLVSGPLLGHFHHQPSGQAAPTYLEAVYDHGRTLGWHAAGHFPFDGIGYHLYLKPNQHSDFVNGEEKPELMDWATHAERVQQHYTTFTKALLAVVREHEGTNHTKRLYISEMGWDSVDNTPEQLETHANNVDLGLSLLADDPQVALGIWFCARDFPGNNKGIFRADQPLTTAQKPAFAKLREFCIRRYQPEHFQPNEFIFGTSDTERDPRSENARQFAVAGGKIIGVDLKYIPIPNSKWELVSATLIDEETAQGTTVARVIVKDKDGIEAQVHCYLGYPWKGWQPGSPMQNRLLPGNANYPYEHVVTNVYDAPSAQGPLAIYIGDAAGNVHSDVIAGLGLPHGRHISFHLVFRERGAASPPPPLETDLKEQLRIIQEKLDRLLAYHEST